MTAPVAEFEDVDAAGAPFHGIADRVRADVRQSGLAVLFPRPVQCLEPRGRERLATSLCRRRSAGIRRS